ncbi:MAG: hypothetical protein ACREOF_01090, partial [Gemmatimonadales bacterium]
LAATAPLRSDTSPHWGAPMQRQLVPAQTSRRRTIGLDAARPGEYTLEMTVTDNRGRRRARSGHLQVVDS